MGFYAAIDLGATSGRVAVGELNRGAISFDVIHRFSNSAIEDVNDGLVWDWASIQREVIFGLERASQMYPLTSVGIDSWGVDYQLLGADSRLNNKVYSYRNSRLEGELEEVTKTLDRNHIYEATGIQFLPFNTIYQFTAGLKKNEFDGASQFLMLPDALNYFLCGSRTQDITNASTTQLLNPRTHDWHWGLIDELRIPKNIFPELHQPGSFLGTIKGHGILDGISVVSVGSHDTASAVAAIPMITPENSVYISSGTWSLIGCEIPHANLSANAFTMNLTNELGVQGTVRLLCNVAGMWLLSECQREWDILENPMSIERLIEEAKLVPKNAFLIDPNDPIFLKPGVMTSRIREKCVSKEDMRIQYPGEYARCIFDSLALAYKEKIQALQLVENKLFEVVYVVGGGSANDFLNQLIADATSKTVVVGAVESTILGNLGMQAIASGEITSLSELRRVVGNSIKARTFTPSRR
jgi:rhamnulokinase